MAPHGVEDVIEVLLRGVVVEARPELGAVWHELGDPADGTPEPGLGGCSLWHRTLGQNSTNRVPSIPTTITTGGSRSTGWRQR